MAELLHRRFQRVDLVDRLLITGERFLHRVAEYFLDDIAEHESSRLCWMNGYQRL